MHKAVHLPNTQHVWLHYQSMMAMSYDKRCNIVHCVVVLSLVGCVVNLPLAHEFSQCRVQRTLRNDCGEEVVA